MPDLPGNVKDMLENYNRGLALYRERKWDEAIAAFNKALTYVPDDGPSKLYVKRCKEYMEFPPPADWDGVYEAKSK